MDLWIPLTLFAAFSQNVRSALQKHLTLRLSTVGTTQARFFYAVPFAIAWVALLHYGFGYAMPALNGRFLAFTAVGGLAQIVATALLVSLFRFRNFFVGTAFSKTEAIQSAVLGLVVLGDRLTVGAIVGISIGVAGVIAVSAARSQPGPRAVLASLKSTSSVIGLLVGVLFGVSAICFRGASLSLDGGVPIQAAVTLASALVLQAAVVTAYLRWVEPGQMTSVLVNWRVASLVGLSGMLASAGWFSAMTLQNAGYVKAVGQIELVLAYLASIVFFREQSTRAELAGISLIVIGIVILLLLG